MSTHTDSSLPPNGLLFVASDVDAADEADFNRWYDREHVEERVRIPGFLSGARYLSREGGRKYLGLYRTQSLAAFATPDYRKAFEQQTPWSVANLGRMRDPIRRVCAVQAVTGFGTGSHLVVLALPNVEAGEAAIARASTMPAEPVKPSSRRSATNTSMVGVKTRAMPAAVYTLSEASSRRRRPSPSESGPSSSWPAELPRKNTESVSCTIEAVVPSSSWMLPKEARYMSVASGLTAPVNPSTPSSSGVSFGARRVTDRIVYHPWIARRGPGSRARAHDPSNRLGCLRPQHTPAHRRIPHP